MGIQCQKYRNPLAPCTGLVGSGLPRSVFKTLGPDMDASFSPIGQQTLVLILNILSLLSVRVHTRMYALVHVCVYLCVCACARTRPCFLAWIWRPCTIVLGTAHVPEPGTPACQHFSHLAAAAMSLLAAKCGTFPLSPRAVYPL